MKKLYEIKTRKVIETYYEIEADSLEDAKNLAVTRSDKVNSITFEPNRVHTREFSWVDSNVGTIETPILTTNRKYKKEFNHLTNKLKVFGE
tara:strand:- start:179 stop:451 length:273 start_codon:yes stop_codon:yes gene_type:complete